jgi:tetratricopeptide (TPR) repeat protein
MQRASEHARAGRLDEAERILRRILAEVGDHPAALHLMGIVALSLARLDEAAQWMERSLALAPMEASYRRDLCEVYRLLGRFDEALVAGRQAAALDPGDAHCHHNLALVHYHRLELDEAIASNERAIALRPDFADAHFGIAAASLLRGDFERGWEEYEWHTKLPEAPRLLPPTNRPQWDGNPMREGTLLVIADQGNGDIIQFARYIGWAAGQCAQLAIACSAKIRPLVAQMPGSAVLFSRWKQAPEFTAYCALSSLPRLAGTRVESIPAQEVPYLRADPAKVAAWSDRLRTRVPAGYRRIGIVWAGGPNHYDDRNRSMQLADFAPVAELPRTALLSLQKGPAQAQIRGYRGRAPLVNLGPEDRHHGFADAMAILECLDLVITVDTSIAHLAGAMGKEAWLMLCRAPDWRWLLDRRDSPWYPTLRLFRQGRDRSWAQVMSGVASQVAARPPQYSNRR